MPTPEHDAVVLAGGRGSRLGGVTKAEVRLDDRTLLDHVLDATRAARRVVVVGPPHLARPGVATVLEDPPGGGPVAGLAAGLEWLAHPDGGPRAAERDAPVLVLACDVPGAAAVVERLLAALEADPSADVALLVDGQGRRQPLVAAWRTGPARRALEGLGPSGVHGASVHRLLSGLGVVQVPDPAGAGADADTWHDVARLRSLYRREAAVTQGIDDATQGPRSGVLPQWVHALSEELGVDLDALDIDLVLNLSRDVAHTIARPAVPLTTFLLGVAVATGGGDRAALEAGAARVAALAERWDGPVQPHPGR